MTTRTCPWLLPSAAAGAERSASGAMVGGCRQRTAYWLRRGHGKAVALWPQCLKAVEAARMATRRKRRGQRRLPARPRCIVLSQERRRRGSRACSGASRAVYGVGLTSSPGSGAGPVPAPHPPPPLGGRFSVLGPRSTRSAAPRRRWRTRRARRIRAGAWRLRRLTALRRRAAAPVPPPLPLPPLGGHRSLAMERTQRMRGRSEEAWGWPLQEWKPGRRPEQRRLWKPTPTSASSGRSRL
mmetsp:Transcript_130180/g.278190  ORF Transcript_130180/g.278190 Transcript_130180/m.278190 type:complete len:240 (-) Transcript_130180:931-1650(-)